LFCCSEWAFSWRFSTLRRLSGLQADAVGDSRPDEAPSKGPFALMACANRRRDPAVRWLWTCVALTCGSIAVCFVLAPRRGGSPDIGLAWLLFLGSSVHVASTAWLFTDSDVRHFAWERRVRFVWAPGGLVVAGMVLSVMMSRSLLAWAVLAVLLWQLHHFQKQNLGQVALAGASLGVNPLRRGERAAICATGVAGIGRAWASPALLQLAIRPPLRGFVAPMATALLIGGVAGGAIALIRRRRSDRPLMFCVMYGLALLFPVPIFLFTSPYAAVAGMTMAHGLQYLLLMGLVAAGTHRRKQISRVMQLAALAVLGGVVLNMTSHLDGDGDPLRLLFGLYLGVLGSHFVVDAGIWRLREPFVGTFLTQRVGYLVRPAFRTEPTVTVADRSGADI
jgi:hypothetical protein